MRLVVRGTLSALLDVGETRWRRGNGDGSSTLMASGAVLRSRVVDVPVVLLEG